jgi:hypothetical protein
MKYERVFIVILFIGALLPSYKVIKKEFRDFNFKKQPIYCCKSKARNGNQIAEEA